MQQQSPTTVMMLSFCSLLFLLFFVIPSKLIKKIFECSKLAILFRVQKQKKEMTILSMENYLPQELVSNILSRLPSRELLKCKCVSKSWFNLITDPHFVTNYYSFYNNIPIQEEHLLVIRRPFTNSSLKTCISILSWSFNEPKGLVSSEVLNTPDEFNSEHKYWSEIMGPCNGIYFLEGNPNVMMNPSLRQFKALPESQLTGSHGTYYSLTDYAGFGFDPKTNDYKVVLLKDLWLRETDERQIGHWTAELYSLNSNSWRKLDDDDASLPLPIEICGSSRVYTYVKNSCHWWGFDNESGGGRKEDIVLSFDMVNEVFRKIKVPRIRESSEESFATLAPFEESSTIGAIVYPVRGNVKSFDVWVMRDYWEEGSWIKQYTVGPIEVIDKVMGFIGSYRFVWKCNDEGLVLHQAGSEKTRDLKDYGKNDDSLRAAVYKESLFHFQGEMSLLVANLFPEGKGITFFN